MVFLAPRIINPKMVQMPDRAWDKRSNITVSIVKKCEGRGFGLPAEGDIQVDSVYIMQSLRLDFDLWYNFKYICSLYIRADNTCFLLLT
jgi:hypothetical protein